MSIISKLVNMFDNQAKQVTLSHLQSLSERQLIDCGFSPALLSEGVAAWPWREVPEIIAPVELNQTSNITSIANKAELETALSKTEITVPQRAA